MELQTLCEKRIADEISDPLDKRASSGPTGATEVKPIAIKPAWKSSRLRIFEPSEPHAVTYVSPVPTDRYNFVRCVVLLQGIAMFLPINMFLNAETFFQDFKFNTIESGSQSVANETVADVIDRRHLIFYFCITSSVSSLIAIVFNVLLPISPTWSLTRRFTLSAVLQALVISLIVILTIADTTAYRSTYLFISLTFVILLNVSNGLFQTCVHAMTSFLPISYRKTLMFGLYFGGSLITGLQIMSNALIKSQRLSYIYYFVVSILVLLFSYDSYYISPFSRFYRYFRSRSRIECHKHYHCLDESCREWSLSSVVSKSWKHYLNIYLVCLVSYSIYPSLSVNAKPVSDLLNFIPNQYYNPITTHLAFNMSSTLGSLVSFLPKTNKDFSPKLCLIAGLRLSLIPLYVFLYFSSETRRLLGLLNNDLSHLLAILLLGLSNGFLLTISVMKAPKSVRPEESMIAGMLSALFHASGLLSGALVSLVIYIFIA